jgi:hypothetical protein
VNENRNEVGNKTIQSIIQNIAQLSTTKVVINAVESMETANEDAISSIEKGIYFMLALENFLYGEKNMNDEISKHFFSLS